MVPVICINDKNIPEDYPRRDLWVKAQETYTLIDVKFVTKSNCLGFVLEEIDSNLCHPYLFFNSIRFIVPLEHIEAFFELVKNSRERDGADDFDVQAYVNEVLEKSKERELAEAVVVNTEKCVDPEDNKEWLNVEFYPLSAKDVELVHKYNTDWAEDIAKSS